LAALQEAGGPESPGWGWSVSHRDWFRHSVGLVLDLVTDPEPLRALNLDDPVVLTAEGAAELRAALDRLRAAIRRQPAEFARRMDRADCPVAEVLAALDRAATGDVAKVDDDNEYRLEDFFRYLRQQEVAAAEAARSGRSLVTLTMA
jgi:hypothetical protein